MKASLSTLLDGVIDYAGLFPPAKLTMAPAVEEFLAIADGEDSWLVSRFACPAGRLSELAEELETHALAEPLPIAVVGTGGKDRQHWSHALQRDRQEIASFRLTAKVRGRIEAYETRLPDNHTPEFYIEALSAVDVEEVFAEIPWLEGAEEALACLAGCETCYAKARTGGATPSAFPSVPELAAFIQQCVHLDVPFKLTAGLHHPLPARESVGQTHGFLNVLVATTLAMAHDLSRKEIERILAVQDARAFSFASDSLSWEGFEAGVEEIESARELFLAFGSCSVAEPLAELKTSGTGS